MVNDKGMDIKTLIAILNKIFNEMGNYEIWLSIDEEGNEFIRMLKNTSISMMIESKKKRVILFPSGFYLDKDSYYH